MRKDGFESQAGGLLEGWREVAFIEAIELIGGGTPKTSMPEYWRGDIPWLSVGDFNHGLKYVNYADKHISQKGLENSSTRLLSAGDIIISARGTVGVIAMLGKEMAFNQSCYGIRPLKNISDNNFIFYALKNAVNQFQQIAHGAVFDTITRNTFEKINIALPPLPEQKAIAAILGALDDKIEANRKMNATLEGIARALFKSWFVDFDPVRAKAEGRPSGLPVDLDALFPASFTDSPLGEIPMGWESNDLSSLATLNPETWNSRTKPQEIRYVDLSNTKWGKIEAVEIFQKDQAPSRAQRVLRLGDTIIGTVRPGNGSYAFIGHDGLTGSTGFAVIRPNKKEYFEFVYLAATEQENIDRLSGLADGGAYPAVRPEVIMQTQICLPSSEAIQAFSETLRPIFQKIEQQKISSQTLATLRDTLLPKLISGQIRVGDAEKLVEDKI